MVVQKRGETVNAKMGRPTNNPLECRLQVRVSKDTLKVLDECAESLGKSRSAIVRAGICLVKSAITKK